MAIFITGDTHGDFSRFENKVFYEQNGLTKKDCVIITGDFGGIWDGSTEEQLRLDWLEEKPFTTLFVSGNHENFNLLAEYPVEDWHGGKARRIRPSVIHLTRGQVYNIQGKTFFTMGGASSHDIDGGILEPDDPLFEKKCQRLNASGSLYRVNHRSWWKEELPSEKEYQTAQASLDKVGWDVDYIITHCCPSSVQDIFSGGFYQRDALTDFFDEVRQRCRFQYWFFGHYHDNMVIEKKYAMLYKQIIKLKL
jgi:DNA repair exonuclease SbcCD nuclease subunit